MGVGRLNTFKEKVSFLLNEDGTEEEVLAKIQSLASSELAAKTAVQILADLVGSLIHDMWVRERAKKGFHGEDNRPCPFKSLCLGIGCKYFEPYLTSWDTLPEQARVQIRDIHLRATKNKLAERGLSLE